LDVIRDIEGIVIVDLIPSGIFVGRSTGRVALVGEWPGGPFNTPTEVEGDATIRDTFKGFSLSLRDPLSPSTNPYSNGCAFTWLKNKRFRSLVLSRVDMTLAEGVKIQLTDISLNSAGGSKTITAGTPVTLTDAAGTGGGFRSSMVGRTITISGATNAGNNGAFTISAVLSPSQLQYTNGAAVTETSTLTWAISPGTLEQDIKIPAGTRVYHSTTTTREFALAQDVVIAAGTNLLTAAFTAFNTANLAATYATRTVSAIPVYSVQGVSEAAVGNVNTVNATDLFRAGIGTGAQYPNLSVAASTGALDGAAANAAALTVLTSAQIDSRYATAIDSTLPGVDVTDNIEIIAAARQSASIRVKVRENARDASAISTGRVALSRPPIGTLPASANGSSDPGVGGNRADRNFYCYPHFEQNIPELAELDPTEAISSANILLGADAAMATILSNLPPENNPGQSTQTVISGGLLSFVRKLEDGLTGSGQPTKFTLTNYIAFKDAGVAALRRDTRLGEWVFQSGITSVSPTSYPSLVPIKRRRMADFLQDSMAAIALKYDKQPNTAERYDSLIGDLTDFLELMLSQNNSAAQRISAYAIDSKSGNTEALQGTGIRVVIVQITLLDTMDEIVLQVEAGETVVVTSPEV
jgi:hypothetical protein